MSVFAVSVLENGRALEPTGILYDDEKYTLRRFFQLPQKEKTALGATVFQTTKDDNKPALSLEEKQFLKIIKKKFLHRMNLDVEFHCSHSACLIICKQALFHLSTLH